MAAYLERGCQFVVVARKTAPLLALLREAEWKLSPKTDADAQCEFACQPEGWEKTLRFVALRYEEAPKPADEVEQYRLFASSQYIYRVLVTDMQEPIHPVVAFYNGRAGDENLIKEANNDAGLSAFNREEQDEVALRHTTLATARLRGILPKRGSFAPVLAGVLT